ncbi:MAG: hypothetical protein PHU85_16115 [Phycisphaerae bacterium]|nr:hypothetical protein [Phycisphaerae bacterium]
MTRVTYAGWPNCYRIANKAVELIVTGDVGPRVIRFGFVGGPNEFREYPDMVGKTGGDEWRLYGGHRLWHSPECKPRTYFPDNMPVRVEALPTGLRVVQPAEATTGIAKEIDLELVGHSAHVTVTHRLRNENLWAVTLAPWALSVMEQNGVAILPLPAPGEHQGNLLPAASMALWAYTDMSDPRWTWGRRFVLLRQDPKATGPQKVGLCVKDGWGAYARAGHLFVKRFAAGCDCGEFPDFGCNAETYTDAGMLELESLGPLTHLHPSAVVEHVENWFLFDGVPTPASEADVVKHVLPKVKLTE